LLREIADELEVSTTTVVRWLDPAKAQRMRERARDAKLARRVPCERCGHPLGYERSGGLCRQCTSDDAHARIERVAALYDSGARASEIAREVGLRPGYVALLLTRLAHAGRITLRYAPRDRESTRERERQIASLRGEGSRAARSPNASG
jgi:ribosomal protein S14